jgi:Ca2+-binding EF-hand superfamily protein
MPDPLAARAQTEHERAAIQVARSSLQDSINVDIIQYVKKVFHKADVDGGGDLSEHEFVQAFTGKLSTEDGSDEVCS